jgi:hypothetical protein
LTPNALCLAKERSFSLTNRQGYELMSTELADTLYSRAEIDGNALGDEIVFFDDRVGKYFAVSPVGSDIWKLLESPMTLDAIVAGLLAQYEVEEATCRAETLVFLQRMLDARLLSAE